MGRIGYRRIKVLSTTAIEFEYYTDRKVIKCCTCKAAVYSEPYKKKEKR
jgi:hypothetical protein